MPGIAVFIRSHVLKAGQVCKGVLMYPGDRGKFKTPEAKEKYEELFEGKAPFLPYHGVGKRYAETVFTVEELREAKLEHMERKFSKPKNADDAFWRGEEEAFDSLVFPLGVVRGAIGKRNAGAVRGARYGRKPGFVWTLASLRFWARRAVRKCTKCLAALTVRNGIG